MSRARILLVTLTALIATGCGGSHHSSGPSEAPLIRMVDARQPQNHVFLFAADTYDAQADLFGGTAHIRFDAPVAGSFDLPITQLLPGANQNDPEADVVLALRLNAAVPHGINFAYHISVTDRAGHTSNEVTGLGVTERRVAGVEGSSQLRFDGEGEASLARPR